MTGKTKFWPVKSTISPDIVRWPAVISSPVMSVKKFVYMHCWWISLRAGSTSSPSLPESLLVGYCWGLCMWGPKTIGLRKRLKVLPNTMAVVLSTFSAISTLSGGIISICSNSSSKRFSMFVSIWRVLWKNKTANKENETCTVAANSCCLASPVLQKEIAALIDEHNEIPDTLWII